MKIAVVILDARKQVVYEGRVVHVGYGCEKTIYYCDFMTYLREMTHYDTDGRGRA